jgi:MerR, DNA binding
MHERWDSKSTLSAPRSPFRTDPDQSCGAVDAIARARLGEVERRIESLLKLKAELERMLADCSKGRVAECHIIEVLANRSPSHAYR